MNSLSRPIRRLRLWVSLILASLLLTLASGAWPASAQEQSDKPQKEELAVKSPWGSFDATVSSSPGKLGLPLYPGAKLLKEDPDKNTGSMHFDLSRSGKPDVHFMVGKFQTPDSLQEVREFYRKKLGSEVTKYTEKTDDGGSAFEIKHDKNGRFVALKNVNGGTEIDLVRVEGLDLNDK